MQFIASAPTLFPAEYVSEFQSCLDRTPSVDFSVIENILREELGRPISEVYEFVDPIPLASASVAQVGGDPCNPNPQPQPQPEQPRSPGLASAWLWSMQGRGRESSATRVPGVMRYTLRITVSATWQVHAGRLKGSQSACVIKVLKPGVEDVLKADLNFLYVAARVLEFLNPELSRTSLVPPLPAPPQTEGGWEDGKSGR